MTGKGKRKKRDSKSALDLTVSNGAPKTAMSYASTPSSFLDIHSTYGRLANVDSPATPLTSAEMSSSSPSTAKGVC